jgi:aspartate/methionine/tyrosine aminotransferase
MRRDIVHEGAGKLTYEIREIVAVAKRLQRAGVEITWENIGDPVQKGEKFPDWMKAIVSDLVMQDQSYAYSDTMGVPATREFLAAKVNERGGCKITADDIVFFNGLGDAVAKVFGFLRREARVIGPSPAYSTLSSAEAAHSGYDHMTYALDPKNGWLPDINELEQKARFNDSIAGILLINPDNPTGVVYTRELLLKIVDIARKNDLFVICDETYTHIVYNGAETVHLSEVIGEVPGMALRSISKEYPWPGARCGWLEVFNKEKSANFQTYLQSLIAAKRLEVCSTTLPQLSIPLIMGDARYPGHLKRRDLMFEGRAKEAYAALSGIEGVKVSLPQGAFYFSVYFDDGVLNDRQRIPIPNPDAQAIVEEIVRGVAPDKRLVYYLLGATGICGVPLTGFCSQRHGFRVTLLETDDAKRRWIYSTLASSIRAYLGS